VISNDDSNNDVNSIDGVNDSNAMVHQFRNSNEKESKKCSSSSAFKYRIYFGHIMSRIIAIHLYIRIKIRINIAYELTCDCGYT
jgi:hypothetical protein